jgi:hypothetical protein
MAKDVSDILGSNIEEDFHEKPAPVASRPKPKTVRIILDDNENIPPTGQFFGLNGQSFLLKANVEADVPIGIIDILDNAVESKAIIDPLTRRVVGHTQKRRYSYQRVASAREMAARDQDAQDVA